MTIAITGAAGQLGRLVVEKLMTRAPASQIVALVRSPERAADLGVTAREFDYSRPELLGPGLVGVDTLLLISSNAVSERLAQHRNVLDAAKQAGVERVVYTSLLHADTSPLDLAKEHLATEAAVRSSGLAHTVLRDGWYAENYTSLIPAALERGAFAGCARHGRISFAGRADYAEAAAVILTSAGHDRRTYELAGDEAFTLSDLAAELSRQAGRNIPYLDLPEAEYAGVLIGAGLPEVMARAVAGWDSGASQGALFDEGRQLSRLIGRPTLSLPSAVAAAL
jgi:NAD(P)H dehydrogenase (quinone)